MGNQKRKVNARSGQFPNERITDWLKIIPAVDF